VGGVFSYFHVRISVSGAVIRKDPYVLQVQTPDHHCVWMDMERDYDKYTEDFYQAKLPRHIANELPRLWHCWHMTKKLCFCPVL